MHASNIRSRGKAASGPNGFMVSWCGKKKKEQQGSVIKLSCVVLYRHKCVLWSKFTCVVYGFLQPRFNDRRVKYGIPMSGSRTRGRGWPGWSTEKMKSRCGSRPFRRFPIPMPQRVRPPTAARVNTGCPGNRHYAEEEVAVVDTSSCLTVAVGLRSRQGVPVYDFLPSCRQVASFLEAEGWPAHAHGSSRQPTSPPCSVVPSYGNRSVHLGADP
jgi:hypothetical protein